MGSIDAYRGFSSRAAYLAHQAGAAPLAQMPEGKHYQACVRRFVGGAVEVSAYRVDKLMRLKQSRAYGQTRPPEDRYRVVVEEGQTLEQVIQSVEQELQVAQDESRERALRRSRQRVRWLVKTIGGDHMLTLTYRENMTDRARLKRDWQAFVRLMRARYPEWVFVAVPEEQDRGALHLHCAVAGRQDIKYIRRCWYKALGASPDASGPDAPGQIDVRAPAKRWGGGGGYVWHPDKLAGYLIKYLHKAFDHSERGSKRYWASQGIAVAAPERVWLGAACFSDAIIQTHDIIRSLGVKNISMWASDGYDAVWISG